jgi:hypothetical protein
MGMDPEREAEAAESKGTDRGLMRRIASRAAEIAVIGSLVELFSAGTANAKENKPEPINMDTIYQAAKEANPGADDMTGAQILEGKDGVVAVRTIKKDAENIYEDQLAAVRRHEAKVRVKVVDGEGREIPLPEGFNEMIALRDAAKNAADALKSEGQHGAEAQRLTGVGQELTAEMGKGAPTLAQK